MTIEERAEVYKQKIQDEASSEGVEILAPNAYYAGYKQGATEQRTIDIEKACEWFRKENSHAIEEWLDMECEKLRAAMSNN